MRIVSQIVANAAKKKGKGEELSAVEKRMFEWAVQENERRRKKANEGLEQIGTKDKVPIYRRHFIDQSKYTCKKLRKMRKDIAKQAAKEFPELKDRFVDLWEHDPKKEVTTLSRQQLRYMKRKA